MLIETLRSESEEQTIQLGEQFAGQIQRGDVVALYGELGAGKTEFVKGICGFFAVEDLVTSPTFTIINQYAGHSPEGDALKIYHVGPNMPASTFRSRTGWCPSLQIRTTTKPA
jgi:tRNA threonylcarbamoyl adenosine modification protein YjeE